MRQKTLKGYGPPARKSSEAPRGSRDRPQQSTATCVRREAAPTPIAPNVEVELGSSYLADQEIAVSSVPVSEPEEVEELPGSAAAMNKILTQIVCV